MTSRVILIISVIFLTAMSCGTYEDGPAISFLSRTSRLTNSWTYSNVYRNGLDVTTSEETRSQIYGSSTIGFAEDGRFSYIDAYRDSTTSRGDGFWEFIEDNEKIQLTYDSSGVIRELKINRLESSFLWLEEDLGDNNTIVLQLSGND